MKKLILILSICSGALHLMAQPITYPYPVHYLQLTIEQQLARMAYMDVAPERPNGQAVLLLHGKNFNGFYWTETIKALSQGGYRVVVPDQVGWGRSDKPNIHYSFHLLAYNTKALLDSLGIEKVHVVGHSMGGMLATRFTLMYPQRVGKLVYENPIGLEDYKTFVPYQTADRQYAGEMKATYESLKNYQKSYYPEWKPRYEPYVQAQYEALQTPDFSKATWASALTYLMIMEQPVVYEFNLIKAPVLLIIGQEDRTVVGRHLIPEEIARRHGHYPELGRRTQRLIPGARLVELKGIGHIPHIQDPKAFHGPLLEFLEK